MSTEVYGAIEILTFFGGVMAFCLWQLRILRRSRAEDEARKARGEPEPEPGPKTREDIFWDTMTRKKKKKE